MAADRPAPVRDEAEPTTAPLMPAQARFFAEHTVDPGRFQHAVLLDAETRLDPAAVRHAFATLRDRHDSLRLTFAPPVQHAAARGGPPPDVVLCDLRGRDDAGSALQDHAATLQASFDLATGPLFRLAIVRLDERDRLLVVVHHLAIDVVSWRVLIEELEAIVRGKALPTLTDSFLRCAVEIGRAAETDEVTREREDWDATDARVLQSDGDTERARYRDQERARATLSPEETAWLLTSVNQAYNTTTEDILLAALARALHAQMGRVETPLTLEHHGRDPRIAGLDASRTVGWFTSLFPFVLELDPARDLAFHIKATKEAVRAIPHRGMRYGLLRYGSTGNGRTSRLPRPGVSFNYLGQIDRDAAGAAFRLAAEPIGGGVSPDAECLAAMEISGLIAGGRLQLAIAYNRVRFGAEAMQALATAWCTEIAAAIEHCRHRTATELTPADLTYSGLSVDELEDMFS